MKKREVTICCLFIAGLLPGAISPPCCGAADLVWDPSGSAAENWVWNAVMPAWTNIAGGDRVFFADGDTVSFTSAEANALDSRTVTVEGTMSPAGLLFSGDRAYTFSGGALNITSGLKLGGTGTVTFNTPLNTPRTELTSGTLVFSGPSFDAGYLSASSGTIKAGGTGDVTFSFSVPEGQTGDVKCGWDKGGSDGISVRKKGAGGAFLNVSLLSAALGSGGRIYAEQGSLKVGGYSFGNATPRMIFEVSSNAVLTTSGNHALGGVNSGARIFLRPGGTFDSGYTQYISQEDPGLWLMGHAAARCNDLRNEGNLYVKAEGQGNLIGRISRQRGHDLFVDVAENGDLHVEYLELDQTVTKRGEGTLSLGQVELMTAKPVNITAGAVVATNNFTRLANAAVAVSEGASFENRTGKILWLENTASSGTFRGVFGVYRKEQNFKNGLRIAGELHIRGEGFQADYTGLTVDGYIGIDNGRSEPVTFPATLSTDRVTAVRVTSPAENPANLRGSAFPVPLEVAADAHVLIPVEGEPRPVTLSRGASFAAGSTVHLSPADTLIPAGTYPVFTGITALPAELPQIAGHLSQVEEVEWVVENGALCVKVTVAGTVEPLTWRPAESEPDGSYLWSGTKANWETAGGMARAFTQGAPAIFDGESSDRGGKIIVAEGQTPGSVTFSSAADYILSGAKLGGIRSVVKAGTGTLTLDGAGFSFQPIYVSGGTLKLGPNAWTDALGDPSATVEVGKGGTVDINYAHDKPDEFNRNELTHRKTFKIEGAGTDGKGALVNSGPKAAFCSLSKVELTGDATVGGTSRFDMRTLDNSAALQKRPLITGPEKVLTVKNSEGFVLVNADADLKKIVVSDGGVLRLEGDSKMGLAEGIDLCNGTYNTWELSTCLDVPLRTRSGENNFIKSERSGTTFAQSVSVASGATLKQISRVPDSFRGPVSIEPDASLEISGTETRFYGSLTNQGTLKITAYCQNFIGPVHNDGLIEINGGLLNWGRHDSSEWPSYTGTGRIEIPNGALRFIPGADFFADGNFRITGSTLAFLTQQKGGILLTNTVVENRKVSISDSSFFGNAILGEGCDIKTGLLYLGDTENAKSSQLRLLPGVTVRADSEEWGDGGVHVGRNSGSSRDFQHELSIEGGTLINTNTLSWAPFDAAHGTLFMSDGVLDVKGFGLRRRFYSQHGQNERNTTEYFVMSGGLLKIGPRGLASIRTFIENGSGYYMNGGVITNTAAWGATLRNLAFAGDPVVWELGEFPVDFNVPLQGGGDLTIRGNASFNTGRKFFASGTVRGHWTVENRGENVLVQAAAFTGGLTLAEGVSATVDIPATGYVRLGVYAGVSAKDCEAQMTFLPYLDRAMPYAHRRNVSDDHTSYLYAGDFHVDAGQAGTWTFAECYDDEVYLKVDGEEVLNDTLSVGVSVGKIALQEGWHSFRLAVKEIGGDSGPADQAWINKNMGIGWAASDTSSTDASAFTPFSPDRIPMRPTVTGDDRIQFGENSVFWSRHDGKDDSWKTLDSWNMTVVTNTLKILSVPDWPQGLMAVNRFRGWFFVDESKAGIWTFKSSYDDYCALWIDGFDSGMDGTDQRDSTRSFNLVQGWHRFEIRTYDYGGNCGPWYGIGNAVSYRINQGGWQVFDEESLTFRASLVRPNIDCGFIGGLLDLKGGSRLTNLSSGNGGPCAITGTLRGCGTLEGPFAFATNGVWQFSGNARDLTEVAKFSGGHVDPDTLKDLRRVKVSFSGKPLRTSYEVCDSLGLEKVAEPGSGALPSVEVIATDPSETEAYPFTAAVQDGKFVLVNGVPPGTVLILK